MNEIIFEIYLNCYNIPSPLYSIDATGILESHEGIAFSSWAVHILQLSKLQRFVFHFSFLELGCQGILAAKPNLLKIFGHRLLGGGHIHVAHKELSHHLKNQTDEKFQTQKEMTVKR